MDKGNPGIVRPAAKEDVSEIARLEKETFPMPWSAESIRHDIEENELALVAVAEADGQVAGYADVWQIAGEGQLNNIAVFPEFRGKHFGWQLMEYLIRELVRLGNTEMSLEVRESNSIAIAMYRRLGFEEVGRREKYYLDNGETAILMRKEFRAQPSGR